MAARIAFFFGNFQGGGVQRVRLSLAREFMARGIRVDLVVVNAHGDLRKLVPNEATVVDLGASRAILALPALVHYLRAARPAAVLSSQTHHNVIAIIARWLSRCSTRLVVGEHHNIQEYRQDSPFAATMQMLGARLFFGRADAIVAVSKGVADALSQASGIQRERIQVINNPITIPEILNKAEEAVSHAWFDQRECPVLIAIGRLTRQKDFPTLLKTMAILKTSRKVRLVILGEGEDEAMLRKLVSEYRLDQNVQLLGFVSNPYAYLSRSDVFVLSSRWEGFPNTLLEALACGTPVVATDCPSGPAEMLVNGQYGHLVPVGDPDALAHAIDATLDSPPHSKILKQRAEDFSISVIGKQYVDLLLKQKTEQNAFLGRM